MTKSNIKITGPKGLELLKKSFDELTDKVGVKIVEVAREHAPRSEYGNDNHYMDNINYYSKSKSVIAENNYSAAIEYGIDKEILIKPHQRVITQAFGKKLKKAVIANVKLHRRQVFREPNPVLRNAAKQVQGEVNQIWKETLKSNGL